MKKNKPFGELYYPTLKKTLKIMRNAIFLLIFSVLQAHAIDSYAQKAKLSLNYSGTDLISVLDKIETESEFFFLYNEKLLNVNRKVDINLQNKPIEVILENLFSGTDVKYTIIDRKIILAPQYLTNEAQSQQRRISGRVTDTKGEPVIGANVVVTGTTTGALTDVDGKYSLDVPQGLKSLTISFIGMVPQEVAIGASSQIDVTMSESAIGLEEVVVIGYGTTKKATVTGSVSSVVGDKLQVSTSTNITNSLSGMLPGLVVVSSSGEPGRDDALLRIRGSNTLGNNSPLIVIDGIANRSLQGINSADIESITVLKDASAAIYGAQAANGVILVTTKRGVAGKPQISISYNQGIIAPTVMPKMADAATWAQMVNEIDSYRSRPSTFSETDIQKFKDGSDPWSYPNTDWFAQTYKKSSLQNNANFILNGGSDKLQYYFSAGYKYQDGNYINSATNYSQADFRSNIDGEITDNIKLSISLLGRQENRHYSAFDGDEVFRFCMHSFPTMPAYWPNGLPGPDIEYGENPVIMATDETGYDKDKRYIFESNMKLEVNIPWVKGLSITGNASIDKNIMNRKLWQKPWYLYNWDGTSYDVNNEPVLIKALKGLTDPKLTQMMEEGGRTTLNALINYERKIAGNHNIKILVGSERITGESMNFSAFRRYFASYGVQELFAGGDLEKNATGSASKSARLNYFGRFNYNYKEKYLLEFVGRYDGSYMFPANSRFGFFPGISLGWRLSEEDFWKNNIPYVSYFKLRGSWGQTGNDRIEEYQYLSSYGFGDAFIFNHNVETKTMHEMVLSNPNVTWEVANQTDIGIDAKLGENLTISADYFYNLRTNILWWRNASVPATTGLSLPRENIGEVINQGFDFEIGYNNSFGDLKYTLSLNGSYQKNKIKFWDETPGVPDYQRSTGRPINSNLYYQAIGVFADAAAVAAYPHRDNARPGDIIFEDVNKDEVIDGLDMVRSDKTGLPTFTGGINLLLNYKQFYATIYMQGAAGAALYFDPQGAGTRGNFLQVDVEDRWTVNNINTSKPRAWNAHDEYWTRNENTYFLKSTDYMRLKNMEIGYNLSNNLTEKLSIKGLRVYLSGTNLLTMTKLHDYDPEADETWGVYPPQKVYNMGILLTF